MLSQISQKERSESDELATIFNEYSSDMLTYARYRLGGLHSDMAEDIVQESFLALWKNMDILEQINPEDRKRFLISVVKCRVVDFLRKKPDIQKISIDDDESFLQLPDLSPSIENRTEGQELYNEIRAAIHKLDETYRSVMEMKYIFHLKESEMARLLNISEKNISVRVVRGRKKLQKILKERFQQFMYDC